MPSEQEQHRLEKKKHTQMVKMCEQSVVLEFASFISIIWKMSLCGLCRMSKNKKWKKTDE